jgi:hypothetical protein
MKDMQKSSSACTTSNQFVGSNGSLLMFIFQEVIQTLRARFHIAKEEVNAELAVFAGDLNEILERNPDAEADWLERTEDLLILANQCAVMDPDEFLRQCEGIVHDLDEKWQELPIGKLKTLHTRMLFILMRCTRLLQYLKENGSDEDGFLHLLRHRIQMDQSLEKHWNSVVKGKKLLQMILSSYRNQTQCPITGMQRLSHCPGDLKMSLVVVSLAPWQPSMSSRRTSKRMMYQRNVSLKENQ